MRVIRSAGQNVSPSDDANLFEEIFIDGLFEDAEINSLGSNQVSISALYGIMQGRDFTSEAQTLNVELPTTTETTGYIYVQFDVTSQGIISFGSALAPFTPTYEDINGTGTICQMILAEYVANPVQVQSITSTYDIASLGGKRDEVNVTLAYGSWSGVLYTITNSAIKADKLITLTYPLTITDEQYTALSKAVIRPTAVADGSITLRAMGKVPTIDIPITLVIER